MDLIDALIQGIIQGATEFLPVSSSGHLSVYQHFAGITGSEAVLSTIVMHLGTLVAVFVAFRGRIAPLVTEAFRMLGDIFKGKFRYSDMNNDRRMIVMIIVSILPLFVFYIFKDVFERISSDGDILIEGIAFLYTSALLYFADKHSGGKKLAGETTAKGAVTIGVFQGIALIPGVSRSGSTISGALLTGMKRDEAVAYSFILGIPVILAGAVVEIPDALAETENVSVLSLVIGFAASAVAGYFAIKLLDWLLKSDRFRIFSVYTFILGIAVIAAALLEYAGIIG